MRVNSWLVGVWFLLSLSVGLPRIAHADLTIRGAPTTSEETITVSTTALGITAGTCGTGNRGGALIQVTTNAIYATLNGPTVTPDSNDFRLYAGDFLYVKPASKLRMLRQSADSIVKVQCFEE